MSNEIQNWYKFIIQQMAVESYLEQYNRDSNPRSLTEILKSGSSNLDATHYVATNTRLTDSQINFFEQNFKIINTSPSILQNSNNFGHQNDGNSNSGFSATLFYDNKTATYTLSFRSTEFLDYNQGGDWQRDGFNGADGSIAFTGLALAQIDDMEKYWQNVVKPIVGDHKINITGYSLGGHLATVFTEMHSQNVLHTYLFNSPGRGFTSNKTIAEILSYYQKVLNNPEYAEIPYQEDGDMNLYLAAKLKIGESFGDNIYLDPRYMWAIKQTQKEFGLEGILTASGFLSDDISSLITSIYGQADFDDIQLVANKGIHSSLEERIFIEDQPDFTDAGGIQNMPGDFGTSHSITLIADSLAVMDLFINIDPTLEERNFITKDIDKILSASSNQRAKGSIGIPPLSIGDGISESDSLEKVVEALAKIFVNDNLKLKTDRLTGGFSNPENREAFYKAINDIKIKITDGNYYISLISNFNLNQIKALALQNDATGIATCYAIKEANPFIIIKDQELYSAFNKQGELDLSKENSNGQMTENYISDRIQYLKEKFYYNDKNQPYDNSIGNIKSDNSEVTNNDIYAKNDIIFDDQESQTHIQRGSITASTKYVLFGGQDDDILQDAKQTDHLYGGNGNDKLIGNQGNDYLEGGDGDDILNGGVDIDILKGGKGFDTYIFKSGDGMDVIEDSDKLGLIRWDNQDLGSTKRLSENVWLSKDDNFRYNLIKETGKADKLIITSIKENSSITDQITINNFTSGMLGILLEEKYSYTNPQIEKTWVDDSGSGSDRSPGDGMNDLYIGNGGEDSFQGYYKDDQIFADDVITIEEAFNLSKTQPDISNAKNLLANGNYSGVFGLKQKPAGYIDSFSAFSGYGGNDLIVGNGLWNHISGGGGKDILFGGGGNDLIFGDQNTEPGFIYTYYHRPTNPGDIANYYLTDIFGFRFFYSDQSSSSGSYNSLATYDNFAPTGLSELELFRNMVGNDDIISGGTGDDWISGEAGNDTLQGDDGSDIIFGGQGNDVIDGSDGNDILSGDALDDGTKVTWEENKNNNIVARSLSTDIRLESRYHGNDFINGGTGNDWIWGNSGNDNLLGGSGDDQIFGGDGNDILNGGTGIDYLCGDKGNDIYIFENGDSKTINGKMDIIEDNSGNNKIIFKDLNLDQISLIPYSQTDLIIASGNNKILIKNALFGAIKSFEFSDGQVLNLSDLIGSKLQLQIVINDSGNSTNSSSPDYYGGSSGDFIIGALNYASSFHGGLGNDTLNGGNKDDNYFFKIGDGRDIINDQGGINHLIFDFTDNNYSILKNFKISINNNSAKINYSNQDEITYNFGGSAFPEIQIINNQSETINVQLASDANKNLTGTENDDLFLIQTGSASINGGGGNDIINLMSKDKGNYTINLDSYLSNNSSLNLILPDNISPESLKFFQINTQSIIALGNERTIILPGLNLLANDTQNVALSKLINLQFSDGSSFSINQLLSDHIVSSDLSGNIDLFSNIGTDQNDVISGNDGNNLLFGQNGSDIIFSGKGDDEINGNDGDDILFGGEGRDILSGGPGNDELHGESGSDKYLLSQNMGQDQIIDDDGGILVLPFGISVNDLSFENRSDGLWIGFNQNNGVLISGFTDDKQNGIWKITDSSGKFLSLTNTTPHLIPLAPLSDYNPMIENLWSERHLMIEQEFTDQHLSSFIPYNLQPNGYFQSVWNWQVNSSNITTYITNEKLDFKDVTSSPKLAGRNIFTRFDKTNFLLVDNLNLEISETRTNKMIGKIYNSINTTYEIELVEEFRDGDNGSNIIAYKKALVNGGGGNDIIISSGDNFNNNSTLGTFLVGGEGNDTLAGYNQNDVLIGDHGNDILDGLWGKDTYIFYQGDGNDIINSVDFLNDDSIILPSDVKFSDLEFSWGKAQGYYNFDPYQSFYYYDGAISKIFATLDISWVNPNGSIDTIQIILPDNYDLLDSNGFLQFGDGSIKTLKEILTLTESSYGIPNDPKDENNLLLQSYFYGAAKIFGYGGNDEIHGGTVGFDLNAKMMNMSLTSVSYLDGGDGDDLVEGTGILVGGKGADQLIGRDTSDVLGASIDDFFSDGNIYNGGKGNDYLLGTINSDIFIFNQGDGQDVIGDLNHNIYFNRPIGDAGLEGGPLFYTLPIISDYYWKPDMPSSDYQGYDTIRFGAGINPEDIKFEISGNDLLILNSNSPQDQIKITDGVAANYINNIEFADGTKWNQEDLQKAIDSALEAYSNINNQNNILFSGQNQDSFDFSNIETSNSDSNNFNNDNFDYITNDNSINPNQNEYHENSALDYNFDQNLDQTTLHNNDLITNLPGNIPFHHDFA